MTSKFKTFKNPGKMLNDLAEVFYGIPEVDLKEIINKNKNTSFLSSIINHVVEEDDLFHLFEELVALGCSINNETFRLAVEYSRYEIVGIIARKYPIFINNQYFTLAIDREDTKMLEIMIKNRIIPDIDVYRYCLDNNKIEVGDFLIDFEDEINEAIGYVRDENVIEKAIIKSDVTKIIDLIYSRYKTYKDFFRRIITFSVCYRKKKSLETILDLKLFDPNDLRQGLIHSLSSYSVEYVKCFKDMVVFNSSIYYILCNSCDDKNFTNVNEHARLVKFFWEKIGLRISFESYHKLPNGRCKKILKSLINNVNPFDESEKYSLINMIARKKTKKFEIEIYVEDEDQAKEIRQKLIDNGYMCTYIMTDHKSFDDGLYIYEKSNCLLIVYSSMFSKQLKKVTFI